MAIAPVPPTRASTVRSVSWTLSSATLNCVSRASAAFSLPGFCVQTVTTARSASSRSPPTAALSTPCTIPVTCSGPPKRASARIAAVRTAGSPSTAAARRSGSAVTARRSARISMNVGRRLGSPALAASTINGVTSLPRRTVSARRAAAFSGSADASDVFKTATSVPLPRAPRPLIAAARTAGSLDAISRASIAGRAARSPRSASAAVSSAWRAGASLDSSPANCTVAASPFRP